MLDQNITTLLAALIGGLLSALGGFLANYYIQNSSTKLNRRKEIRNTLEKVYKSTIDMRYSFLAESIKFEKETGNFNNLVKSFELLKYIEYLVNFYLPPLKNDFVSFRTQLELSMIIWRGGKEGKEVNKSFKEEHDTNKLINSFDEFLSSITDLQKKEGYNYFQL